ncbi:hypothetical protein [Salisediminibacterium selenitireducens]|uniref:Uncharacterized protein n=1 Tax=Bacillus selenitireducens (strain ATCC 700615 / DSM 15326 / MLS10) TaxID=439292 RepID=D6XT24_BACIE|nr:hypothetical protein [Salisediminibacterium selenitireducens]ADH98960.1 hypothetical protein Bsel_1448 [[Bacillus] selenitireducens MLS10]
MKKKSGRIISLDHHRKGRTANEAETSQKTAEGNNLVDFSSRKKQKEIMFDMYEDDGESSSGPRLPFHDRRHRAMTEYQRGPFFWILLIGLPLGFFASVAFMSWLLITYFY